MRPEEDTDTVRLVRAFHIGVRERGVYLNPNATIPVNLYRALGQGWTLESLIVECTRQLGPDRHRWAGRAMFRLQCAAEGPPAVAPLGEPRPFCDECRENRGMLLDPETMLPIARCPCRTQPNPEAVAE